MTKCAHYVVYYITHLVTTFSIGFRPLKHYFSCKVSFTVLLLANLTILDPLKLRFFKISIIKFAPFVVYHKWHLGLICLHWFQTFETLIFVLNNLFGHFLANLTILDPLKLRFLKISTIKFAHFVVCHRRHLGPTVYTDFRSLKPYFSL